MKAVIEQLLGEAVAALKQSAVLAPDLDPEVKVFRSRSAEHGDFSTNLALTLAQSAATEPRDLAKLLVQALPDWQHLCEVAVAGSGFINFHLLSSASQAVIPRILSLGTQYGQSEAGGGARIQLTCITADRSCAIACGSLSLDEGRCVAITAAIANLLRAAGCCVQCDYRAKLAGADGELAMFATDIAYLQSKLAQGFDHLLYIYCAERPVSLGGLQAASQMLGPDSSKFEFLPVQSAGLSNSSGRQRFSGQEGRIYTAKQLCDEVGSDALHFFYLERQMRQPLQLDLNRVKSHSSESPLYRVQYAHARICSVLRQTRDKGLGFTGQVPIELVGGSDLHLLSEALETRLLTQLAAFPEVIEQAARAREPQQLTSYLQALANGLNKYYVAHKWLVEDLALCQARVCLILAAKQVLANGLDLIGVSAPEVR